MILTVKGGLQQTLSLDKAAELGSLTDSDCLIFNYALMNRPYKPDGPWIPLNVSLSSSHCHNTQGRCIDSLLLVS